MPVGRPTMTVQRLSWLKGINGCWFSVAGIVERFADFVANSLFS